MGKYYLSFIFILLLTKSTQLFDWNLVIWVDTNIVKLRIILYLSIVIHIYILQLKLKNSDFLKNGPPYRKICDIKYYHHHIPVRELVHLLTDLIHPAVSSDLFSLILIVPSVFDCSLCLIFSS
jgi:hypothetical protein